MYKFRTQFICLVCGARINCTPAAKEASRCHGQEGNYVCCLCEDKADQEALQLDQTEQARSDELYAQLNEDALRSGRLEL